MSVSGERGGEKETDPTLQEEGSAVDLRQSGTSGHVGRKQKFEGRKGQKKGPQKGRDVMPLTGGEKT